MMPGVGFIGGKLSILGGYSWPGAVDIIEQWDEDRLVLPVLYISFIPWLLLPLSLYPSISLTLFLSLAGSYPFSAGTACPVP